MIDLGLSNASGRHRTWVRFLEVPLLGADADCECNSAKRVCVVCGCKLTSENQSESPNVCFDCLRYLER